MTGHPLGSHDPRMLIPWSSSADKGAALAAPLLHTVRECHMSWREAAAVVAEAYAMWRGASAEDRAQRFAAYCAALDREAAAAEDYASALVDCERSLDWPAAR
jgi:hypothetical protein